MRLSFAPRGPGDNLEGLTASAENARGRPRLSLPPAPSSSSDSYLLPRRCVAIVQISSTSSALPSRNLRPTGAAAHSVPSQATDPHLIDPGAEVGREVKVLQLPVLVSGWLQGTGPLDGQAA